MSAPPQSMAPRPLWPLIWPLLLANLSAPLLGLVDMAVVGHLSAPSYLAAVAVGSSIFMFVYFTLNFLRMGTTGLVAQQRQQPRQIAATAQRALWTSLVLGVLLLALSPFWLPLSLTLMGASDTVTALATTYTRLRLLAAPLALANMVLLGVAIGMQRPRLALLITVSMHSSNAVLDVVLVHGLNMGVSGVAIASAIAELIGVTVGLWGLADIFRHPEKEPLWQRRPMLSLFRLNRDLFLRSLALLSVFFFFTAQGARHGDAVVAANALLISLFMLISNLMDAVAHAAEARVGEAHGQRQPMLFKKAIYQSGRWALGLALCLALALLFGAPLLLPLMTPLEEVTNIAMVMLPALLLLTLTASAGFWLDGVFVGCTWSVAMRNTMLVAVAFFFVSWSLTRPWGNAGLWLSLNVLMLSRSVSMAWVLQQRWPKAAAAKT